jgi:hypothetical protein
VSCAFFLVVETGRRSFAVRVPEAYKPPQDLPVAKWDFSEPYVAFVVRAGRRGAQVVVARNHGAATASVSLYGLVRGRLRVLRFPTRPLPELLTLFGSVGTGVTQAGCSRGGPLVIFNVAPLDAAGKRWRLGRTEYQLIGTRFRVARSASVSGPESRIERTEKRWRMPSTPFAGCVVARGPGLL